jgi:hypothetical protein
MSSGLQIDLEMSHDNGVGYKWEGFCIRASGKSLILSKATSLQERSDVYLLYESSISARRTPVLYNIPSAVRAQ